MPLRYKSLLFPQTLDGLDHRSERKMMHAAATVQSVKFPRAIYVRRSLRHYDWLNCCLATPTRPADGVAVRGMAECRSGKQFVCDVCEVGFAYPSKLKRHQRSRKHALFETVSKRTRRHHDADELALSAFNAAHKDVEVSEVY